MDPILYKAAMEGYAGVLMQHMDQLDNQRTPNGNTVLHVAAQFNRSDCVALILEKCPILLCRVNNKGETPLHIAAREGFSDIVKALIDCAKELDREVESGGGAAKEMLRATTHEDRDTALHMAVRTSCNGEVIRQLISEDPEFQHPANKAEETPLYLAAEIGDRVAVSDILNTCTSPAYGGPGGRTALHAAAMDCLTEIVKNLLKRKQDLIKEVDKHGRTPLHYAARCDSFSVARVLLETDKSVAYIPTADIDGEKTALHIAAAVGAVEVMKEILSYCPDSWEMVDSKGQNILHIAVNMEQKQVFKFIGQQSWSRHLVNQKDKIEGNTPIHLLAAGSFLFLGKVKPIDADPGNLGHVFNNENMTPVDVVMRSFNFKIFKWAGELGGGRKIFSTDEKIQDYLKEQKEQEVPTKNWKDKFDMMWKRIEGNHFIVATLIATVTFTAGFTLPGGYNGSDQGAEKGMAILVRKAAFQAFVITNTIALICSTSSALLYVTASFYGFHKRKMITRYLSAFLLIVIAMGSMTIAFITGSYAVLAHSLVLAIVNCAIGCLFFLIYFLELKCWSINVMEFFRRVNF